MTAFFDNEFDRLFKRMTGSLSDPGSVFDAAGRPYNSPEPFFYGYTVTVGPDGRPAVREYDNARPGLRPSSDTKDPLVETIVDESQKLVKMVAEIPGVEKSDIRIRVDAGTVHIDAERGEKRFNAAVPLKQKVDISSAKASYRNGILELAFKQLEQKPKGRIIEVR